MAARAGASAAEKVTAHREIVAGLTALQPADGGPPYARRSLAAAHQKLAEAYLAEKRYDEAKASMDLFGSEVLPVIQSWS